MTLLEKLNEMQMAGCRIFLHASPKETYGVISSRLTVEFRNRDGDGVEIKAGYSNDITTGQAIEEAYLKWQRVTKALPEFDGRFLIEGKVGEVIDDEIKF